MWMRTGTWRSGAATSLRLSGGPTARPRCRQRGACSRCCARAVERGALALWALALRLKDEKIEIAVDQSWLNVKGVVRGLENVNDSLVARDAPCLGIARVVVAARGAARGGEDDGRSRQRRSGRGRVGVEIQEIGSVSAHLARLHVEPMPAILAINANVASDVHDRAVGDDQRSISHVAYTLGNSLGEASIGLRWRQKVPQIRFLFSIDSPGIATIGKVSGNSTINILWIVCSLPARE